MPRSGVPWTFKHGSYVLRTLALFAVLWLLPGGGVHSAFAGEAGFSATPVAAPSSAPIANAAIPRLAGIAGDFYRPGQSPEGSRPGREDVLRDLPYLAYLGNAVRLFGCQGHLEDAARSAADWGLVVVPGAWLGPDRQANEVEIECLVRVVARLGPEHVPFAVVGSEAILRGDLTADEVVAYAERVAAATGVATTTSEPETVWTQNHAALSRLSLIGLVAHPYWNGVRAEGAVQDIQRAYGAVSALEPRRPVVITEAGWPSCGATNGAAVPSVDNMRIVFEGTGRWADEQGISLLWLEHRSLEWKGGREGQAGVGACWGLSTPDGVPLIGPARLPHPGRSAVQLGPATATPVPVPPLAITRPNDGEVIADSPITISGTVDPALLTGNRRVLVAVRDPLGQYWIQPDVTVTGSAFTGVAYVGEARDAGRSFPVVAFITDLPLVRAQILRAFPGPACPGCLATLTVVRR